MYSIGLVGVILSGWMLLPFINWNHSLFWKRLEDIKNALLVPILGSFLFIINCAWLLFESKKYLQIGDEIINQIFILLAIQVVFSFFVNLIKLSFEDGFKERFYGSNYILRIKIILLFIFIADSLVRLNIFKLLF